MGSVKVPVQNAHEVNDRIHACQQPVEFRFVVYVGLHYVGGGENQKVLGALVTAGGDAQIDFLISQAVRKVPANKPAAAKNADIIDCHGLVPSSGNFSTSNFDATVPRRCFRA